MPFLLPYTASRRERRTHPGGPACMGGSACMIVSCGWCYFKTCTRVCAPLFVCRLVLRVLCGHDRASDRLGSTEAAASRASPAQGAACSTTRVGEMPRASVRSSNRCACVVFPLTCFFTLDRPAVDLDRPHLISSHLISSHTVVCFDVDVNSTPKF